MCLSQQPVFGILIHCRVTGRDIRNIANCKVAAINTLVLRTVKFKQYLIAGGSSEIFELKQIGNIVDAAATF